MLCSLDLDVLRAQRIIGFFTHKSTRSETPVTWECLCHVGASVSRGGVCVCTFTECLCVCVFLLVQTRRIGGRSSSPATVKNLCAQTKDRPSICMLVLCCCFRSSAKCNSGVPQSERSSCLDHAASTFLQRKGGIERLLTAIDFYVFCHLTRLAHWLF